VKKSEMSFFISHFLAGNDAREEFAHVLGRQRSQCNNHLRENGKLLWIFSSLLFLGDEVDAGDEERGRHFRTVSALWQAPRFIG
jgi:hypothetical protein